MDYMIIYCCLLFFFKQKTAYEMRISDWSSDVCSSDLHDDLREAVRLLASDAHGSADRHLLVAVADAMGAVVCGRRCAGLACTAGVRSRHRADARRWLRDQ